MEMRNGKEPVKYLCTMEMDAITHNVLALVASSPCIDVPTLIALGSVSKATQTLAMDGWVMMSKRPRGPPPMHTPTHHAHCTRAVAKRRFALTDEDLGVIGVRASYFRVCDVFHIACAKHGGPRAAMEARYSASKRRRSKALRSLRFPDLTYDEKRMVTRPFLRNGRGGMRGIHTRVERLRAFRDTISEPMFRYSGIQEAYVMGSCSLMDAVCHVDALKAKHTRIEELKSLVASVITSMTSSFNDADVRAVMELNPDCRAYIATGREIHSESIEQTFVIVYSIHGRFNLRRAMAYADTDMAKRSIYNAWVRENWHRSLLLWRRACDQCDPRDPCDPCDPRDQSDVAHTLNT